MTLDDGLALEARAVEQLFEHQGRARGLRRVRREAQAGVRRSLSMTTETDPYAGSFIAGASTRTPAIRCPVINPADGRALREVAAAPPPMSIAAVAAASSAFEKLVEPRRVQARRDPRPRPRTTSRSTSTS